MSLLKKVNNSIYKGSGPIRTYSDFVFQKRQPSGFNVVVDRGTIGGGVDAPPQAQYIIFDTGSGFNSEVYNLALYPDGTIGVVGFYTAYKGETNNRIIKLLPNGDKDTSFNIGTGANTGMYVNVLDTSQNMYVGTISSTTSYSGSSLNENQKLLKIKPDGTLDLTFRNNFGSLNTLFQVQNPYKVISYNNDDSVLVPVPRRLDYVADSTQVTSGPDIIIKVNNDGTGNSEFNSGAGLGSTSAEVRVIKQQVDGKFIIGTNGGLVYSGSFANRIAKVTPEGILDPSFVTGRGLEDAAYAIAHQPDGKVLVGGIFFAYDGISTNSRGIVRINTDGTRDTSFNTGNGFTYTTATTQYGDVRDIKLQSDGKIIVGGDFTSYSGSSGRNRIIRLNTDGTVDTSFNVGVGANGTVRAIGLQSDEKVIIVGNFTSYSGSAVNRIVRLNTNGTIDSSFNIGAGANAVVDSVNIQSDGKVFITGNYTSFSGSLVVDRVTRLNTDGTIDATFNVNGGANARVYSSAIQNDGKIIIAGGFTTYAGQSGLTRIIRLNTDGTRDTSFNPGAGTTADIYTVSILPEQKILIGGNFTTYSGSNRRYIASVNSDGTLDSSLFVDGTNTSVEKISISPDNSIFVLGSFDRLFARDVSRLFRINSDGTLDSSFSANVTSTVRDFAIQEDGKIIVGTETSPRISRLNSDGTVDNTFSAGAGFNTVVNVVRMQADEKVVVGGAFTTYQSVTANRIIRLLPNGDPDPEFITGSGFNGTVNDIQIDNNNLIYVGGAFTTYKGSTANRFIRLDSNGDVNVGF